MIEQANKILSEKIVDPNIEWDNEHNPVALKKLNIQSTVYPQGKKQMSLNEVD